ncbi:tail fiber protein [Brucella sp. 458]|uniref:phage tail protein n=1 Tax=Brucella sp. 458 TaxID=2821140 RepID=UPI001ADEEC31|nr:tail fiber protein [Brucella sp. 458]QTO00541.1 tail fiber protein [Brucella sp. 458]
MPFDSQGKYSLPPIYKAVTGEKVLAEQHNIPFEDVAQALSQCLKRDGSTPAIRNLSMSGFLVTDLGDAKNPGDAVSKKLLDAAVPIGEVKAFAGSTPPQGWLLCYGQEVSRTTYAALFAIIGTTFGGGDGGSTFNVPDLRGRVLVGRDDMGGPAANRITVAVAGFNGAAIGASGGAQSVTLTEAQIAPHFHKGQTTRSGGHAHRYLDANVGGSSAGLGITTSNGTARASLNAQTSSDGDHEHELTTSPAGGGQAHLNVQPSIIMNFIIRTGI